MSKKASHHKYSWAAFLKIKIVTTRSSHKDGVVNTRASEFNAHI